MIPMGIKPKEIKPKEIKPNESEIDAVADSPKGGEYGKILFHISRLEPKLSSLVRKGYVERNTKKERKLYNALLKHIYFNYKLTNADVEEIVDALNDKKYRSVIRQPSATTVYRGMTLEIHQFTKLFGNMMINVTSASDTVKCKALIRGRQNSPNTSWTPNEQRARRFASNNYNTVGIVFKANTKSRMNSDIAFIDCTPLYNINDFSEYKHEKEVIALGQVFASQCTYFLPKSSLLRRILTGNSRYVASLLRDINDINTHLDAYYTLNVLTDVNIIDLRHIKNIRSMPIDDIKDALVTYVKTLDGDTLNATLAMMSA